MLHADTVHAERALLPDLDHCSTPESPPDATAQPVRINHRRCTALKAAARTLTRPGDGERP
ncbi:hypothetical protein GCM10010507_37780 [Streptomyces cinnamoneus]|uniref:Uncharacterized protein n=1 Tax=Streptomyces cinnamoneus TaxID=53446 RepID=A0A918WLE7_STRCJ|nr:hypothetical protein GCM10010507_37780 [Streptomyces cinnamoneus]